MKASRPILAVASVAAVVAIVAIAAPASGVSTSKLSKQIKQLKKQVAAVQKQQGPQGAPGTPGAPGSARAFGTVDPGTCAGGPPAPCSVSKAKGISSVTRINPGIYCVVATGVDPATTTAIVGVDWSSTAGPEGNAQPMTGGPGTCAGGFVVTTERIPATEPVAASNADDISFTILIP
jgi:hypothetical protein